MAENGAILGFENKLWDAANHLWANSGLKPSQFAPPVLGLIFLKYADVKFARAQANIEKSRTNSRRSIGKTDYWITSFHGKDVGFDRPDKGVVTKA